jgi:glucan phosphoethanolaminetransferase (alkaline phosphatase superfamily)
VGTPFEEKNFTSIFLVWALVLFIVAAVATLIFSFANVFSNPKVLKSFLVILGIGAVLVLVSYLMASSEPLTIVNLPEEPTASTLKWVGTGLNLTYILAIVAFVGIIASEVINAFK